MPEQGCLSREWDGEDRNSTCRFMGVDLELAPGVLVPRRETEILGYRAIDILNSMTGTPVVADICCGSGNLALAIARHCPSASVWAADLTDNSVALARRNVLRHAMAARITVRQGDLFAAIGGDNLERRFSVIVCNPPYISSSRLENESAHLLENEPREAFDGGPYGISILQRLVKEAACYLMPGGWLLFEFGEGQERLVASLIVRTRSYDKPSFDEVEGKARIAIARRNEHSNDPGARG